MPRPSPTAPTRRRPDALWPLALALGPLLLATWTAAHADPPSGEVDARSEDGDRRPRLLTQAALRYPTEAIRGEHGDVLVRVLVDAEGRVARVEVLEGPEVFHAEARRAAEGLRFDPGHRDGAPVAATVLVTFHFAPPEHVGDDADEGIVVVGEDPDASDTHARTTLDEDALERSAAADLGETVAAVAGVTTAPGAADISKPIIRGQVERRLLLINDGVRHASQKWGPDHAPEIDPFSAGSVGVVKGAAGVRYGPDAIGGVILVDPPPMREEPGVGGRALLSGSSNGRRGYAALRLDAVPAAVDGLSLRLEGNLARGAALSAPDYVLGNTASRLANLGGAVAWRSGATELRLVAHHHELRAGVFYGVRNSTPADFEAQLDATVPPGAESWTASYAVDRPYQAVSHDLVAAHLDTRGSGARLHATYAFQLNRRREYEPVRDDVTGPQYDFVLRTHSLDLLAEHPAWMVGAATFAGGLGASGVLQENVYRGLPLLPNFRAWEGGVYAVERATGDRGAVELGARVDHLSRTAWLGQADYERHARRGTLGDGDCTLADDVARCPAAYDAASLSLGALWRAIPDVVDVKLDLSSASRFPNADELYLIGSAPSLPAYAIGAPDLRPETTWGASPTVGVRLPWLEGEASVFASRVDRFVYFAPELDEDGEPAVDVTVRGAFPRFAFRPIGARFTGADGRLSIAPDAAIGLEATAAVVRAVDRDSGAFLVGTPADRARLALVLRPPELRRTHSSFVELAVDLIARQSRVDLVADLAAPPDGVVLLGLAAGTDLDFADLELHLGVEAHNLLDTAWRSYTSLLRYYADQPGRDVRVRLGARF